MGIKAAEARVTTRGKDLSPALAEAYSLFAGGAELTSRQVAESLDVKTSTAWQRVRALYRRGKVRRVNGIGPGHPAVYKKASR